MLAAACPFDGMRVFVGDQLRIGHMHRAESEHCFIRYEDGELER